MPYEEALLSVHITRALLAIPTAIKDLKHLLSRPKPEVSSALEQLEDLQKSIITFCDAHKWLREAKDFHDYLATLDTSLEEAFQETLKARAEGPFNPEAFSVPKARQSWDRARHQPLERLLSFACGVSHIEKEPLQTDSAGAFVSGPVWARKLLELRSEFEPAFAKYDARDMNVKPVIANTIDRMVSLTKSEMARANEMIRKEAGVLADELNKLQGALGSV